MNDELISYDTAKLAKEKGFNEDVYNGYNQNKELSSTHRTPLKYNNDWKKGVYFSAPTQSLLQRWLREEHGMHIVIIPTVTSAWTFKTVTVVSKKDDDIIMGLRTVSDEPPYKNVSGYDYSTYEECLEEAMKEILEQI